MNATAKTFATLVVLSVQLCSVKLVQGEYRFGPVSLVPAPINDEHENATPSLSRDMLTMYFASNRPGTEGISDIWMSTRATISSPWTEPARLPGSINSGRVEMSPSISADGLELYFRRADTFAEGDGIRGELYVSTRSFQSDPWGLAEKLAAPINLPGFDQNEPSISMFDGLELYFNSTRPEDDGQDIYFARRATPLDPFGEPELFRPVSGSPFLSADGLKFFFVTPVLETLGADDFYVMTRDTPDGEFGVPIHLAGISSSAEDWSLIISADESTVYFSTTRGGGRLKIWQATAIPEPSTMGLAVLGVLLFAGFSRTRFGAIAWGSAVLILLPLSTAPAATTLLVDDFNDGNDVGWKHLAPAFLEPGIFDATSGAYHIQSTTASNTTGSNWLVSAWEASAENPIFANGLIRAKVRANRAGVVAGPGMRGIEDESVYWFVGDTYTHSFFMVRSAADGWQEFQVPGVTFRVGEDWIIEGGSVGDELSMKVWRVGETPPETPQLMRTDAEPLAAGKIALISYIDVRNQPVKIDASFDDISFTPVPEPAAGLLTLLGIGSVACIVRRR